MSNATVAVAAKVSKDDIPFNPKVHYKKKASDWVIDVIIWLLLALRLELHHLPGRPVRRGHLAV